MSTASLNNTSLVFTSNGATPNVTLTPSASTLSCSGINGSTNIALSGISQLGIIGNPNLLQLDGTGITANTHVSLGDNINLKLGNSSALTCGFNGTNSVMTSTTGNLFINNTALTGKTQLQLGTTNANTKFEVLSSTGGSLFSVDGAGTITGGFSSVALGTSDDTTAFTVTNSTGSKVARISASGITGVSTQRNLKTEDIFDSRFNCYWKWGNGTTVPDDSGQTLTSVTASTSINVHLGQSKIYRHNRKIYIMRNTGNILELSVDDPTTATSTGVTSSFQINDSSDIFVGPDGYYAYGGAATPKRVVYASFNAPTSWSNLGNLLPFGTGRISIINDGTYDYIIGGEDSAQTLSASTHVLRISPGQPSHVVDIGTMTIGGQSFGIKAGFAMVLNGKVYVTGHCVINGSTQTYQNIYSANLSNLLVWTDTGNIGITNTANNYPRLFTIKNTVYYVSRGITSIYSASVANFTNTTPQLTTIGAWTAGTSFADAPEQPAVLFNNNRLFLYGLDGGIAGYLVSPVPTTAGSTGNWVFTGNNAGLAGNLNLISLSTARTIFNYPTRTANNVLSTFGDLDEMYLFYNSGTTTGALELQSGKGTLSIRNIDSTHPLVLKSGSTNNTATALQYVDASDNIRFRVYADGTGSVSNLFSLLGGGLVSGGSFKLNDNIQLVLGTSSNFTAVNTGAGTTFTSGVGNLMFNNTVTTGRVQVKLGSSDSNTNFETINSSGTPLFSVTGVGQTTVQVGPLKLNDNIQLVLGSASGFNMAYSGGNTALTSTTGNLILNTVGGNTKVQMKLGSTDANTFVETLNSSNTVLMSTSGAGLISIPIGPLKLDNNVQLVLGTSSNFTAVNTGTGTTFTSGIGNLLLNNTVNNAKIQMKLGSTDANTRFEVLNSSNTPLFYVDGAGAISFGTGVFTAVGGILATGGSVKLNNNIQLILGTNDTLTAVSNGSNTTVTSAIGDLTIDNTNASGKTIFKLGSATNTSRFDIINSSSTNLFAVVGSGEIRCPPFGEYYNHVASLFARKINPFNSTTFINTPVEPSDSDPFDYEVIGTAPNTNVSSALYVVGDYVYLTGSGNGDTNIYRAPLSNPSSWTNVGTGPQSDGATVYYGPTGVYFYGCNNSSFNEIWYAAYNAPTTIINTGRTLPAGGARLNRVIQTNFGHLIYGGHPAMSLAFLIDKNNPANLTLYGTISMNISNYAAIRLDNITYVMGSGSLGTTIYRIPDDTPLTPVNTGWSIPTTIDRPGLFRNGDFIYLFGNGTVCYRAHKSNLNSWTTSASMLGSGGDIKTLLANGHIYLLNCGSDTNIYRSKIGGNKTGKGVTVNSINTPIINNGGAITYTAKQVIAGIIYRTGQSAAITDTLPSAQSIVSNTTTIVGTTFDVKIVNAGTYNITIALGSGGTGYHNGLTIGPGVTMAAKLRMTSVTIGSETYDFFVLSRSGQ